MGLFLHTAIIPNCNEETVHSVLERLAQGENPMELDLPECKFFSNDKGVQVLFNEYCNGYDELAESLSKETGQAVMLLYIYDDDFWGYHYCENGVEVDQFMPVPDYFDDEKDQNATGNPALIAARFNISEDVAARYLIRWSDDYMDGLEEGQKAFDDDECRIGDCWQMVDFMAKLGWPWRWDDTEE